MSCYVSREVTTLVPILSQFKVQTPFPRHHTIVRAYRRLACSVRRLSLCLSNASRLRHHVCASGCFAVRSEAAVRCSNCVTGRRRRCCPGWQTSLFVEPPARRGANEMPQFNALSEGRACRGKDYTSASTDFNLFVHMCALRSVRQDIPDRR